MKDETNNPNQYDPFLPGKLNEDDEKLLEEFGDLCSEIASQLEAQSPGYLREASIRIYNNITSFYRSIIVLLRNKDTSKIVVAALFRSLIDCCVSIFAFCKDPQGNAMLYYNFLAVLDWITACRDENNFGCPLVPDSQEKRNSIQEKKNSSASELKKFGLSYTNTKKPLSQEQLEKALEENRTKVFRDKWYEEERKDILNDENMEWINDVIYKSYSSATHSDPAGSLVLDVIKSSVLTYAIMFWSAGIYRLAEEFNIRMSEEHNNYVRQCYKALQRKYKPSRPE